MPKLFPLIDAVPTWVIYTLILAGVCWYVRVVIRLSIASWYVVRYEWKHYKHRRREAAIAEERMHAQAEAERFDARGRLVLSPKQRATAPTDGR